MTRVLAFDLETTGIDVNNDRIVTAYLAVVHPEGEVDPEFQRSWVIDPVVEIPAGAAAVHGYTTERIRAEGRKDVAVAVGEIISLIAYKTSRGIPLAGYNLSYDLSLLEAERKRHTPDLPPFEFGVTTFVLDGLVLDKAIDRYRKGSRKLVDAARHYGVPITAEEAHAADADAVASARIVQKLLQKPALRGKSIERIHDMQISAKAEQAAGLQAYFRRTDPEAFVDPGWPLAIGRAA